jgi:hypothetical protein
LKEKTREGGGTSHSLELGVFSLIGYFRCPFLLLFLGALYVAWVLFYVRWGGLEHTSESHGSQNSLKIDWYEVASHKRQSLHQGLKRI